MSSAIEVCGLSKKFKRTTILNSINLNVEEGTICGIIGRNGSGKTVLFKCICGFLLIDEGKITVEGKKVGKGSSANNNMGIIIETPGFLRHYSGYRNLEFLAGLKGKADKARLLEVLKLVGLSEAKNKKVGKYSMGMKQRLGIAQAIMDYQKILILDEPMNGLDNQGVEEIRKLLLELKKQRTTILIASHNKDDISQLCDVVYEMNHGELTQVR